MTFSFWAENVFTCFLLNISSLFLHTYSSICIYVHPFFIPFLNPPTPREIKSIGKLVQIDEMNEIYLWLFNNMANAMPDSDAAPPAPPVGLISINLTKVSVPVWHLGTRTVLLCSIRWIWDSIIMILAYIFRIYFFFHLLLCSTSFFSHLGVFGGRLNSKRMKPSSRPGTGQEESWVVQFCMKCIQKWKRVDGTRTRQRYLMLWCEVNLFREADGDLITFFFPLSYGRPL